MPVSRREPSLIAVPLHVKNVRGLLQPPVPNRQVFRATTNLIVNNYLVAVPQNSRPTALGHLKKVFAG